MPPFVLVEGTAELTDDPDELLAVTARLGGRSMSAERAAEFGARNGVPGELLVRVTPARVVAQRDIAG